MSHGNGARLSSFNGALRERTGVVAERVIDSIRRWFLDHVLELNEAHLLRVRGRAWIPVPTPIRPHVAKAAASSMNAKITATSSATATPIRRISRSYSARGQQVGGCKHDALWQAIVLLAGQSRIRAQAS